MGLTLYDVLGVSADATQDEITEAYRNRVLETHPDRNDDPGAAEAFKRVTAAEEVLSDESERARYDRLGHEAYIRVTEEAKPGQSAAQRAGDTPTENTGQTESGQKREAGSRHRTGPERETGSSHSRGPGRERNSSQTTGPSHHARQRRRRQQQRAAESASWWIGERAPAGGGATTQQGPQTKRTEADEFSYRVHEWTDDVSVERERPPIRHHTAVFVACLAVLYPLLVYSSVTPLFPIPVNLLVAGCTLVIVGYLLTMPKIAIGIFGFWSALMTVLLPQYGGVTTLSLAIILVIAAFWGPLGYAVAVWWALRV